MTDDQIKSGMKALAARIIALEARVTELESAPAKSTRKPKDVAEVAEYFKRHGLNGTADAEARRFWSGFERGFRFLVYTSLRSGVFRIKRHARIRDRLHHPVPTHLSESKRRVPRFLPIRLAFFLKFGYT